MPYKDPEKRRECRRRWYANNKESEKEHVNRRKKQIRAWFVEYKSKLKCSKCGENHPATIDFHHKTRNEKEFNIAFMSYFGYSIERIKKEISKCIILCANCHRKLHYIKRKRNNNV
jgi:transcription elongation factor Elf1